MQEGSWEAQDKTCVTCLISTVYLSGSRKHVAQKAAIATLVVLTWLRRPIEESLALQTLCQYVGCSNGTRSLKDTSPFAWTNPKQPAHCIDMAGRYDKPKESFWSNMNKSNMSWVPCIAWRTQTSNGCALQNDGKRCDFQTYTCEIWETDKKYPNNKAWRNTQKNVQCLIDPDSLKCTGISNSSSNFIDFRNWP